MKSKTIYIYKVTNIINGLIYIGQTSKKDFMNNGYYGSGCLINKAIKKFGVENFNKIILAKCNGINIASELEIDFIKKYNSIMEGYNICHGGNGKAIKHSVESKRKMSEAQKGNKKNFGHKHSEKTKKKMSEIKKGSNNPFFGKNHLNKTKKKLSESSKKRWMDPMYKENIFKKIRGENHPMFGKKHSDEAKRKISVASKKVMTKEMKRRISLKLKDRFKDKNNHPFFGKKHSKESKRKISESNSNISVETRRKMSRAQKNRFKNQIERT